eukprot:6206502-Pleurochrysis_carterae.AAC.5
MHARARAHACARFITHCIHAHVRAQTDKERDVEYGGCCSLDARANLVMMLGMTCEQKTRSNLPQSPRHAGRGGWHSARAVRLPCSLLRGAHLLMSAARACFRVGSACALRRAATRRGHRVHIQRCEHNRAHHRSVQGLSPERLVALVSPEALQGAVATHRGSAHGAHRIASRA